MLESARISFSIFFREGWQFFVEMSYSLFQGTDDQFYASQLHVKVRLDYVALWDRLKRLHQRENKMPLMAASI